MFNLLNQIIFRLKNKLYIVGLNSLPCSHLVRGEHRKSKDSADTAGVAADKRKNCDLHGLCLV